MIEKYLKSDPSDKSLEKRMMELDLRYKLLNNATDSIPGYIDNNSIIIDDSSVIEVVGL